MCYILPGDDTLWVYITMRNVYFSMKLMNKFIFDISGIILDKFQRPPPKIFILHMTYKFKILIFSEEAGNKNIFFMYCVRHHKFIRWNKMKSRTVVYRMTQFLRNMTYKGPMTPSRKKVTYLCQPDSQQNVLKLQNIKMPCSEVSQFRSANFNSTPEMMKKYRTKRFILFQKMFL